MRPLSQDLRVRFCRALDRGLSARAAARLLEVSPATGVRWAQAWRRRGSVAPGKVGGHMRPLLESEREWLLARIEQKKDLTLHELLAELREERGVEVCFLLLGCDGAAENQAGENHWQAANIVHVDRP